MVALVGLQQRLESEGSHREAARAMCERRYLEFVSHLLQPLRPKPKPSTRFSSS
jgi:hypothetical protein